MKLTLKHNNVTSTNVLDSWVEEQIISLQPALKIDEADIILARSEESSPAYQVNVHLVTPGPDVFADGRDHTLRAAFNKTMSALREKIGARATRRQKRQSENATVRRSN